VYDVIFHAVGHIARGVGSIVVSTLLHRTTAANCTLAAADVCLSAYLFTSDINVQIFGSVGFRVYSLDYFYIFHCD